MKDQQKVFKGFWNGEPATFRVVNIQVGDEPKHLAEHFEKTRNNQKRYLWFVPFIGQTLQAVEITQHGQTWFADNSDGAGVHKVLKGGTMNYPHRSIYPATNLNEVPQPEWNEFSRKAWQEMNERSRAGWLEIDPDGYPEHEKRMEALRAAFENSKNPMK